MSKLQECLDEKLLRLIMALCSKNPAIKPPARFQKKISEKKKEKLQKKIDSD